MNLTLNPSYNRQDGLKRLEFDADVDARIGIASVVDRSVDPPPQCEREARARDNWTIAAMDDSIFAIILFRPWFN